MRFAQWSVLVVFALLAGALPLQAAEVAGTWKTEFDTMVGPQKYTFAFVVKEGTLSGSASYERMGTTGTTELVEGRLEGDRISFVEIFEVQGEQVRIEYSGQIAGDEIKFGRKVGDIATEQFVAKRVKD